MAQYVIYFKGRYKGGFALANAANVNDAFTNLQAALPADMQDKLRLKDSSGTLQYDIDSVTIVELTTSNFNVGDTLVLDLGTP